MPHSASAKKRHRQNLRNRERNRVVKSEIRSKVRKVLEAIVSGDVASAKEQFKGMTKSTDRAASSGTIHRNRAARIKSRISARIKNAEKGTGAAKPPAKGRKAATKA
ncbi:MAG: 30S ribosomal protein S20 [Planctomycetia bacterium]|nr:30S ribosomal protein S20 [Planctomycetia bacterium]